MKSGTSIVVTFGPRDARGGRSASISCKCTGLDLIYGATILAAAVEWALAERGCDCPQCAAQMTAARAARAALADVVATETAPPARGVH